MDLERIRYRIYKILPILIPITLIIIACIFIVIGQVRDKTDTTGNNDNGWSQGSTTDNKQPQTEPIDQDTTLTLQQHLDTNCTLVEVTFVNNWDSSVRYETYYDNISNAYEQYKITFTENTKQYDKVLEPYEYNGKPKKVETILESLPTDIESVEFNMLDNNFYAVNSLADGYIWLAQQVKEGNTLIIVKVRSDHIDAYLTNGNQKSRAVITDRYILVDKFIGDVPTY